MAGTNLNLLVALLALLEEANVTRAAERVGVSQAAMSGTLSRLRERFSDALLVRTGRDLEVTPFARELLPDVREALRLIEVAFDGGNTFDPARLTRRFTIAMSDYAVAIVHQPLLTRVAALAPGVTFEFESRGPRVGTERALLDVDVLVGTAGNAVSGTSRLLWHDRMVALVDAENPLAGRRALSLGDIAALPHAVATFEDGAASPIERAFDERGLSIDIQFRISGWLPLPFAVRGTDLIAVVPERLACQHAAPVGRLAMLELPFEMPLTERYWFAPHRASSPEHRWLFEQLDAVSAELGTTPPGLTNA